MSRLDNVDISKLERGLMMTLYEGVVGDTGERASIAASCIWRGHWDPTSDATPDVTSRAGVSSSCSCLTVADVVFSDEARRFSIGTLSGTQHGSALAVAAPGALGYALGLGLLLETMVEAL
ncbi:hypothetical protein MTO96_046232 [Rhipicephalus appendiculatus]